MAKHRRRSRGLSGLGALSPAQLGFGLVLVGGLAWLLLRKKDEPAVLTSTSPSSETPTASDAEVASMIAGLTDEELTALASAGAAGEAIGGLTAEQVKSILPAVQAELAKRTTVPVPPAGASSPAVDVAVDPSAGKPAAKTGVTDFKASVAFPGMKRSVGPALARIMRTRKQRASDPCARFTGQAAVACRAGKAQGELKANTTKVRF